MPWRQTATRRPLVDVHLHGSPGRLNGLPGRPNRRTVPILALRPLKASPWLLKVPVSSHGEHRLALSSRLYLGSPSSHQPTPATPTRTPPPATARPPTNGPVQTPDAAPQQPCGARSDDRGLPAPHPHPQRRAREPQCRSKESRSDARRVAPQGATPVGASTPPISYT